MKTKIIFLCTCFALLSMFNGNAQKIAIFAHDPMVGAVNKPYSQACHDRLMQAFEGFEWVAVPPVSPAPNVFTQFADFDLVVIHPNVAGADVNMVALKALVGNKPVLNFNAYNHGSARWLWHDRQQPSSGDVNPNVNVVAELQNHQIFEGVNFINEDLALFDGDRRHANNIQGVGRNLNFGSDAEKFAGKAHILATYPAVGIQMYEANLDNAAKYLLIAISNEGDGFTILSDNAITLIRNSINYLLNPNMYYDYEINEPISGENMPSRDSRLSNIALSAGTLTPSFNASVVNYTVALPYDASSITLTASANHDAATVVGDGEKSLETGDNIFQITVTAEDGNTRIYTINVRVSSNDATLSNLTVSGGTLTPAFEANTTDYTVIISQNVSNITFTATANHSSATIVGAGAKPIGAGNHIFEIVVTAEDGNTKTYIFTVLKEFMVTFDPNGGELPDDEAYTTRRVLENHPIGELPVPVKIGHTFENWNTEQDGGGETISATTLINSDITLYAQWKINLYTVNFNTLAVHVPNPANRRIEYGQPIGKLPDLPSRGVNWLFVGWNDNAEGNGENFDEAKLVTENLVLYAIWSEWTNVSEYSWLDLNVYPNPATNIVSISGLEGGELISFFDTRGRLCLHIKASNDKEDIAINHLPQGTYFVKITKRNTEKVMKLVVK